MKNNKIIQETVISFYRSKIDFKSENMFAVCERTFANTNKPPKVYFPIYGEYSDLCNWLDKSLKATIKKYLRADLKDGYKIEIKLYKDNE